MTDAQIGGGNPPGIAKRRANHVVQPSGVMGAAST